MKKIPRVSLLCRWSHNERRRWLFPEQDADYLIVNGKVFWWFLKQVEVPMPLKLIHSLKIKIPCHLLNPLKWHPCHLQSEISVAFCVGCFNMHWDEIEKFASIFYKENRTVAWWELTILFQFHLLNIRNTNIKS